MYVIYTGRTYSPMVGAIEGGPTLGAVAIGSGIAFAIYGFIALLIPWPRLITYVSVVWLCRAAFDAVLGWFGKGAHRIRLVESSGNLRRHYVLCETVAVVSRGILVLACGHFFGL